MTILVILISAILSGILWFRVDPVLSQGEADLVLLPPETGDFPLFSVSFDIINLPGQALPDIGMEQLTLVENQQEVPLSSFEVVETGVHFALAVNGGRDFDLRDANGVSPYQKMTTEIIDWASDRSFSPEDAWSFVTNDGIAIHNTRASSGWVTALRNYQPNFRSLASDLTSLEDSIQMLGDWTVPFGTDKALLYITVPPSADQIEGIRALTQEAVEAGIYINVWMIGEGYFLTNDQGGALIELASLTGGQFFHYTGTESLPDPEKLLSPLGKYYQIYYQSEIRQTGTYPLTLTVETPEGTLQGEGTPFYIEVSPPKPILLSPPVSITRQAPMNAVDPIESLEPQAALIEFIVEFPDGRSRELVESRLYVDGALAENSTVPPFNAMSWDLSSIIETGEYSIQIEVIDTLGLSSRTIEMPVIVEVITIPVSNPGPLARQQTGLAISGAILIIALIILLAWGFQQFWGSPGFSTLTQRLLKRFRRKTSVPMIRNDSRVKIYATLIPLNEIFEQDADHNLPRLYQPQSIIGSDPLKADLLLGDDDIDPLHAQIKMQNQGFWINDMGSLGGTWLNYVRIGSKPVEIHPGDILHFGKTGFRFTMMEPSNPPPVQVQKFEPNS